MVIVNEKEILTGQALLPIDVTAWLQIQDWTLENSLGDIAERWVRGQEGIVVPMLPTSPDFHLRWEEMLRRLSSVMESDPAGVLLAVSKSGSDIVEFRASGQIDDSIPLRDASTLIESVRRVMQASANSALQPRSYYGHSVPDAAREHARNVRMGQTRQGSYVVPIISRLPVLKAPNSEDAVLFEDATYQPFARTAMLRLANGLSALRELTHGERQPTPRMITDAVGVGVSSELCDAVANTLDADSVENLDVSFAWAERLPTSRAPTNVALEGGAASQIRHVASYLKGEPTIGAQTFVGYVKRLDRGEEDEIGRITLRALDNDKARNITMELIDDIYHLAGQANTDRRMVSVTGVLHREPSKALHFTEVTDFHFVEELSSIAPEL